MEECPSLDEVFRVLFQPNAPKNHSLLEVPCVRLLIIMNALLTVSISRNNLMLVPLVITFKESLITYYVLGTVINKET